MKKDPDKLAWWEWALVILLILGLFYVTSCSSYKGMSKDEKKAMKERVEYNKTHKGTIR